MFKTNFSGRNKIWGGTKKFRGALPPNAPLGYGPVVRSGHNQDCGTGAQAILYG